MCETLTSLTDPPPGKTSTRSVSLKIVFDPPCTCCNGPLLEDRSQPYFLRTNDAALMCVDCFIFFADSMGFDLDTVWDPNSKLSKKAHQFRRRKAALTVPPTPLNTTDESLRKWLHEYLRENSRKEPTDNLREDPFTLKIGPKPPFQARSRRP